MEQIARMHTAEHILSAVMRLHYDAARNLEFHLNEKKTKCDYEPENKITGNDIHRIEALVNAEIQKDHPVCAEIIHREQAQGFDLWKVPPDAETIRIVRIGDFDAQPCAGRHVEHTAQIGRFEIASFEYRPNGRLRLRFRIVD